MIDVTCKVKVIEVDGQRPESADAPHRPLVVRSYPRTKCGDGLVVLTWRGRSITVSAADVRAAVSNAENVTGSDDIPF